MKNNWHIALNIISGGNEAYKHLVFWPYFQKLIDDHKTDFKSVSVDPIEERIEVLLQNILWEGWTADIISTGFKCN